MKIIWLVVIALFVLLLGFCLFVRVRLNLVFVKPRGAKGILSANIELFGGRVSKSLLSPSDNMASSNEVKNQSDVCDDTAFKEKLRKYYQAFVRVRYTWLKSKAKVRKNVFAQKLFLDVRFGLDDAAATGIAAGAVWAAAYNVIAFLSSVIRISEPEVNITPLFDDELIEAKAQCILSFTVANIISILISIGYNYFIINRKLLKKEKAAINYVNTN